MPITKIHGDSQIIDDTIVNAQINATAAIELTKLEEAVIQADGGQAFTGDQSLGSNKLTNGAAGVADTDFIIKSQLDASLQGLDPKETVRMATTANITLSGTQTIDGVSGVVDDRVLVKNQTTGSENGIYLQKAGAWVRSTDADVDADVTAGMHMFVAEGTLNADIGFVLITNDPIVVGTTPLVFVEFTRLGQTQAGTGLTKTADTINAIGGDGITANANDLAVDLDGTTLSVSASGLKLKDLTDGDILIGNGSNVATEQTMSQDATISNTGAVTLNSTDFPKISDFIWNEIPTVTNGSPTVTIINTPRAGTLRVYLNGARQNEGGSNDYTVSGTTITFTFNLKNTPGKEDVVILDYVK